MSQDSFTAWSISVILESCGWESWAESVNREYPRISRHQTSALMFYDVCTGPSLPPNGVSVVSVVNIGAFLNSLLKWAFHSQFGGK